MTQTLWQDNADEYTIGSIVFNPILEVRCVKNDYFSDWIKQNNININHAGKNMRDKILIKLIKNEEETVRLNIDSRILKFDKLSKYLKENNIEFSKIGNEDVFVKIIKFLEYLESDEANFKIKKLKDGYYARFNLCSLIYANDSFLVKDYENYVHRRAKALLNFEYYMQFGEFFNVNAINLIIDYVIQNAKNFSEF